MRGAGVLTRVATLLVSFVTGAGVGFVLTFTHRQYIVDVGDLSVPFGLIGALAIVAGLVGGMRLAFGDRWAPLAAAVGIVLATLALMLPAHGGSVLVLEDAVGYTWAIGPTVIALVIIGWPGGRRATTPRSERRLQRS